MATAPMNTAAKVAKLRKMAEDKSLPQDVRNQYLDDAVKLEEKGAMKAGVKLAKGGDVMVPSMKKPLPMPMRGERTATNKAKKTAGPSGKPMMYGGAVKPMMAKGGSVKKGKK